MIDKFCEYLTNKIRKKMPEITDEEAEVILYGIQLLIGELPKIFLLFGVGFLLGFWWQTILAFILILPYRTVSGGFHLKTHMGCIICTNLMYCGNAILSSLIQIPNIQIKFTLLAFTLILGLVCITKYAPADTANMPILRKKERKTKKVLSYIILIINLILAILIPNNTISNIFIIGTILQTLTITRVAFNLTKNEYGYETYIKNEQLAT